MNTDAWVEVVSELESGAKGPWLCPELKDADLEVRAIGGETIVEWHLKCPRCGAESFVRRG